MKKPKIHPAACFWPGLPHLWVRGSWAGLAVAVGFTALANTLLLATCVFHQWMSTNAKLIGLGTMVVLWLGGWWQSRHYRRQWRTTETDDTGSTDTVMTPQQEEQRDQLFREAQREYLRSDWVRTEQLLLQLLKMDARDVESRLMLATLWRHQGRKSEALRQLDRLERLEAASSWQNEIDATRRKLTEEEVETETPTEVDESTDINNEETDRRQAA